MVRQQLQMPLKWKQNIFSFFVFQVIRMFDGTISVEAAGTSEVSPVQGG